MNVDVFTILGFAAGAVTSIGFIPQLIKGYRTKKLDDVSYWMPMVLTIGMMLWLIYGLMREDITIVLANLFGVGCNILLMVLKKRYSLSE